MRTTIIDFASTGWRYLATPQTDLATLGPPAEDATFAAYDYDDSGWPTGQAPFGWGYHGTIGLTPRNTTLSERDEVWIRRTLPVGGFNYIVTIRIDNWAYAYFNGHRLDGPGLSPPYDAGFYWSGADNGASDTTISIPNDWLREVNVVALHVFDQLGDDAPFTGHPPGETGYGGGDVLLADMQITGEPAMPPLRQRQTGGGLGAAYGAPLRQRAGVDAGGAQPPLRQRQMP